MIKLDKDKVIPSAIDAEEGKKAEEKLQEEVKGSTKGIQDEPDA